MTSNKRLFSLTSLALIGLVGTAVVSGCADDPIVATPIGDAPVQLEAPAPIAGGTLLVNNDSQRAVIADTDLDQVVIVDLAAMEVMHTIELQTGDEPGRVVAGEEGHAYVALRRGGAVLSVDVEAGTAIRKDICPAPRGLAYDGANHQLHVACAGGELVRIGGDLSAPPTRTLNLGDDLRDVIQQGDKLLVSRFRQAGLLVVDSAGDVISDRLPRNLESGQTGGRAFSPSVAWRVVAVPGSDDVMMMHQRGLVGEIPTGPAGGPTYYGSDCTSGIVHAAVSFFDGGTGAVSSDEVAGGVGMIVLPVDAAVDASGQRIAIVGAGNDVLYTTSVTRARSTDRVVEGCFGYDSDETEATVAGEPVAVAYANGGAVYVQTRQPAMLKLIWPATGEQLAAVGMPGPSRRNWGHALFHKAASRSSLISCASCHPEGRDDGRVWEFANIGSRRTQTMSGGVLNTMPLHWNGDMTSLHDLMDEVFVARMGGDAQPADRIDSLGEWMNQVASVPASPAHDLAAVARGEALFSSSEVGCANCHNGASLTNNATVAVGTGRAFQVPSLVAVAHRAPFMHDGCAATLQERFTDESCGGGDAHGKTSHLTPTQIADLVSYLETL